MPSNEEIPNYMAISARLLRPESRGKFDLFLRHGQSFVLYNSRHNTITRKKLEQLIEDKVSELYITESAAKHYHQYISEHIGEIVGDEAIPLDERAKVWADTAAHLGREIFEENLPGPAFAKRCERFASLIRETSSFLQCPQSLKPLSDFIKQGYESYHHGVSTMVYAINLMQEFQEDDDYEILACGMGALLHDIGKLSLPPELIRKDPSLLTEDEQTMMAIHPMVSVRMSSSFNLPPAASNAILFHHERDDGRGYPTQASGDQLPIHTKIVSLCDAYDNLIRTQPYRKALSPFKALKLISEDEGFVDKEVLRKFIKMLSRAEIV